jgi:hypothetical protein
VPMMSRFSSLWRNLVQRDRLERDLDEEVRAAFELLVEHKVRAGVHPGEAVLLLRWSSVASKLSKSKSGRRGEERLRTFSCKTFG